MANCHNEFQEFYGVIRLSNSKRNNLEESKEAIRGKIRKHFSEKMKEEPPKFHIQGSYAMTTIINPLDEEYDIDDGVYLQNLDKDKSKWPVPETVHGWIYEAVEDHTDEKPIDKRTCVRVVYSGQYHVDLPIYCMYNGQPFLAEKSEAGWHVSDPKALTEWFNKNIKAKGDQLRRVVRYFKAWADNKIKSPKLPSGLVLTILTVNHFKADQQDDVSFSATMDNILTQLSVSTVIKNPIDASETLSDRISEVEMNNFKDRLSILVNNATEALKEKDKEKTCKIWQKEFGERFPLTSANNKKGLAEALSDAINKGELYVKTSAPSIIIGKGKENDPELRRIPSSRSWRAN